MDLHFTEALATLEEREAVDSVVNGDDAPERVLMDPQTADGSGRRSRRHLLLPVLHAVQDAIGWISPGALNYLCACLTVPPAEAYGVATFYALFATTPQPPMVLHICDDIACRAAGVEALCSALAARVGPAGAAAPGSSAMWKRSPCLGLCERAPAGFIQRAGPSACQYTTAPIVADEALALLDGSAVRADEDDANRAVEAAAGAASAGRLDSRRSVPQSGATGLVLLRRAGAVDPTSIDAYRANGGYQALRRALEIGPSAVIRELAEARLSGRGGAAFSTSVKWKAVAESPTRPRYIVCNADESEPGTFKDRLVMEADPFALVEAMTIAGFVCSAEKGCIYIRGEYPEALARLEAALAQARRRGLLGDAILMRPFRFDIEIRRGAGAYICGEETALLNSIEGLRGEPRSKPPYPVSVGLFGKPTAVNNVETLINVLPILASGGLEYALTGSEFSTGTRLFCLSGCIERPGVYEVPYGVTLGDLLDTAGGVRGGRALQAVLLGGAAGVFVGPESLAMPLTLEGARAANATLGSGVVMVFDDTIDLRPILARIASFFRDESCGQCVPCRVGTVRQEEALGRLIAGAHSSYAELALLRDLDLAMRDASICGLGQTASSAIQSAVRRFGLFRGAAE